VKRNHIVLAAVLGALALMFWAGVANFLERRQQQQRRLAQRAEIELLPGPAPSDSSAATAEGDHALPPGPLLHQKPPGFALLDTTGKKVSLSDYRGKAVLINFWATWCGPCKVETPWLVELRNRYAGQGFEILGVSTDEPDGSDSRAIAAEKQQVAKFAEEERIGYPVLLDGDRISAAYGGVDSLPASFFVDRSGTVVASVIGLDSKDGIEANIRKALGSAAGDGRRPPAPAGAA
jgi:cytochrome c biogenesis protein CcmG/thiol:disulfide interchange protein DsbE